MIILYDNKIFNMAISGNSENNNYKWDTALNDTRLSRVGRSVACSDVTLTFLSNTARSVVSVISLYGAAVFYFADNLSVEVGSAVTLANFSNYGNTTYYVSYNFENYIILATDAALTQVVAYNGTDTGTVTTSGGVSNQAVDYVAILGHNLTSGATVTLTGNNGAGDVLTQDITTDILTTGIHKLATQATCTNYKIRIQDAGNSAGYIEIAYIYLGEFLSMPGMDISQVIPYKSNSAIQKSCTGQLYGDIRLKYKAAQISFAGIENDDRIAINTFFAVCDITRPFILLLWETDLDIEPAIYCHLTKDLEWSRAQNLGLLWNLKFEIEECF